MRSWLAVALLGAAASALALGVAASATPEGDAPLRPRVAGVAEAADVAPERASPPAAWPESSPAVALGAPAPSASLAPSASPRPALDALRAGLASAEPWRRREAIAAAADARDASAIPLLAAVDVRDDGYVGAAAIDALGRLARDSGDRSLRGLAVGRLLEVVRAERGGDAPGSLGNVLLAVEALALAGDGAAAAPLAAELLRHELPTSVLVRFVQTLATLGDRASVGAIRSFRDRLALERGVDEFEEQLRLEAIAAADDALRALGE